MAIDWASSDEEEFPDLDVVMARVKASKAKPAEDAPSSRRPPRSRTLAAPTLRSVSPESEGNVSGEDESRSQDQSSTTIARRRKLGPRSGNPLLKPAEEDARKPPSESKAKTQPKVNVRSVRSRKKRHATPSDGGNSDSQGDSLSDFIVYTDDEDSDFSNSSPPPPRSRSSRPKRDTVDNLHDMTEEPEEEVPKKIVPKQPVKKTRRIILNRELSRELSAPIDDAVTDSLSRLDITASQNERFATPPLTPPKPIKQTKTLTSPQKLPGIPKTPHRPSTDLFWDQEFFNEWNEEHSPRKLFLPKVDRSPAKSPAKSPVKNQEEKAKIISDKAAKKLFDARKHRLAESFLLELDNAITDGQIQELSASTGGVKINWSKTLNTTAGRANWKRETIRTKGDPPETRKQHHHASIELAEKVISDEHRLLNVLAHEFCHLANFMITGMTTNPHGKEFKAWASKVSRAFSDREIEVTTKHSYEIDFKYVWACSACGLEYKRHSKSINPERHRCGGCKGSLEQTRPAPRGGKAAGAATRGTILTKGEEAKKKEPTEYQRFVKEQMSIVREENPGSPQKDMMRLVAEKWSRTRGVKKGDRSRGTSVESVAEQLDGLAL